MNSPKPKSPQSRSQAGGRRPSRPPSHLHSDCPPETEDSLESPNLGQRSVSLTTLQPTVIQPRMAQLETLEAKMASIEVSLSSTPRRKKNGSLSGVSLGSSLRSVPKEFALKELETLRNALRDKENIIQNLRSQLGIPGLCNAIIKPNGVSNGNNRELGEDEKKQAEDRLIKLRGETDNKRLAIKNLKMALERLDITDNIDVRIQQAELEYQLGREELNLLTLLEETKTIQICLEESSKHASEIHTLYSCVNNYGTANLHAVEIVYDPNSPRFGAGSKDSNSGLWIDWALEHTRLFKGDRLIEVNGKIVLNKTREDLTRLLAAAPDPAQIVVMRKVTATQRNNAYTSTSSDEVAALRNELGVVRERAEETQKTKDGLVSDNIRLTHRISYLEEQVAELLARKNLEVSENSIPSKNSVLTSTVKTSHNVTNINISSQPQHRSTNTNGSATSDLQIFQKGPQVTALVANLPGLDASQESHTSLPVRSKSSLSNVSNTHIPAPNSQNGENHSCHRSHRHRHKSPKNKNPHDEDPDSKAAYKTHYHFGLEKEYLDRRNKEPSKMKDHSKASLMDQSYKKASMIVHDLTKAKENGYESVYEKHRQKCISASEKYNTHLLKHYNARKSASVLDFRSQINSKYKETRSSERLNNGDNEKHVNKYTNHKKLTDCRSVKSLDFDSDSNIPRRDKIIDYTSEPIESFDKPHHLYPTYLDNIKPRPMPPKKPLRLSLHKTQSLQSVESPISTPNVSLDNSIRISSKRNYNGETQYVHVGALFHKIKNKLGGESVIDFEFILTFTKKFYWGVTTTQTRNLAMC
ncbi:hypothetical protein RN001_012581 [Aquatica leii]|uniref:PDZ domain-containing protein n=1 Tax=Aquatica leii TaxID=1421715 RepID=A0AAN7P3A3_9COLE|nr:hypothetical protein RN001_012581 [Aquatica leii]